MEPTFQLGVVSFYTNAVAQLMPGELYSCFNAAQRGMPWNFQQIREVTLFNVECQATQTTYPQVVVAFVERNQNDLWVMSVTNAADVSPQLVQQLWAVYVNAMD